MDTVHRAFQSTAPRLFLFLPSDLELWDDSDPATHSLRLRFLRDCKYKSAVDRPPTYVHTSKHLGYEIDQPLE